MAFLMPRRLPLSNVWPEPCTLRLSEITFLFTDKKIIFQRKKVTVNRETLVALNFGKGKKFIEQLQIKYDDHPLN